jgi:hypothetical protein
MFTEPPHSSGRRSYAISAFSATSNGNPKERTGGCVSPGGRINLNSGVFNPDLLVPHPSPTVSSIWQTECVLADGEHSRIIEPEQLQGLNGATVAALTTHPG